MHTEKHSLGGICTRRGHTHGGTYASTDSWDLHMDRTYIHCTRWNPETYTRRDILYTSRDDTERHKPGERYSRRNIYTGGHIDKGTYTGRNKYTSGCILLGSIFFPLHYTVALDSVG